MKDTGKYPYSEDSTKVTHAYKTQASHDSSVKTSARHLGMWKSLEKVAHILGHGLGVPQDTAQKPII